MSQKHLKYPGVPNRKVPDRPPIESQHFRGHHHPRSSMEPPSDQSNAKLYPTTGRAIPDPGSLKRLATTPPKDLSSEEYLALPPDQGWER